MQLDVLRNHFLAALGLPLFGGGCATPGTPPSDRPAQIQSPLSKRSKQAVPPSAEPTANSKDAEPASSSIQTAAAVDPQPLSTTTTTATPTPFSPCGTAQVREQLCGQDAHANPESCLLSADWGTAGRTSGCGSARTCLRTGVMSAVVQPCLERLLQKLPGEGCEVHLP